MLSASAPESVVKVTRSWGSHGVSVYGEYWESWRGQKSEDMLESVFIKEAAEFVLLIDKDCSEMERGDSRPIYHVMLELEVIDGPLF